MICKSMLFLKKQLSGRPNFWILLLVSMLLKYGYYGLKYFPVIDDHNMYGVFSLMSPVEVLSTYKMYTIRPIAVLLDTYVISRLWNHQWLILAAITLMHFLTCCLIIRILGKTDARIGIVASIIFALFPLGTDATYWLAASSRLVVGLFMAILSFYLLTLYKEKEIGSKNAWLLLLGFAVVNLISLGFYEQVTIFSFVVALLLTLTGSREAKKKRAAVIPIINFAVIALYYNHFSNTGDLASRGSLIKVNIFSHAASVINKIIDLFGSYIKAMVNNSITDGMKIILADQAFLFLLAALTASACIGWLYSKENVHKMFRHCCIKLLLGIFLTVLPFAPFFLLQYSLIAYRNTFISFLGLGMILEALISLIACRKDFRIIRGILAGILVFTFITANVAELHDYNKTYSIDREIVLKTRDTLSTMDYAWDMSSTVIAFNAKPVYFNPTSNHLINCTAAGWTLPGAMQSILGKRQLGYFLPIKEGQAVSLPAEKLKKSSLVGILDNRQVIPLHAEWEAERLIRLVQQDGVIFGHVSIMNDSTLTFKRSIR